MYMYQLVRIEEHHTFVSITSTHLFIMVRYAESMQELLKKEADEWQAGPLIVSIATSLENDELINLDISTTIGHDKHKPRKTSEKIAIDFPQL